MVYIILQKHKDGTYIRHLKKSIAIKKLEITERALTKDLDSDGLPSIEELVRTGQLIEVPNVNNDNKDNKKIENKIGFK